MAKQPASTRKIKPHTRRTLGVTSASQVITAQERALIWQFAEEGWSQRAIAEKTGLGRSTVARELAKDPVALEQLRAALREARAERTKKLEGAGLDEANGWLDIAKDVRARLQKALETKSPKARRAAMAEAVQVLAVVPRMIQAARGAGADGVKLTQLLTGGVTERVGGPVSPEDMTPDQIIDRAIALGRESELPPRLRARAEQRKATPNVPAEHRP